MNAPRRKKWLLSLPAFAAAFAGLQFVRPSLGHPPATGSFTAPPAVEKVFQTSCYDCHSYETRLRWFDEVAPAYWLVAQHVRAGRRVLNFSNWNDLPAAARNAKLFEAYNFVAAGEMPPASYALVHRQANVSRADLEVVRAYLGTLVPSVLATPAQTQAANDQYDHWIKSSASPAPAVAPEFNGLAFNADYKNWTAISSTDRFDNGTMRVILGNAVAVEAIRRGRTNPWPDGTELAKVTWRQSGDASGAVRAGEFVQVELMRKEARSYAATEGWGFGRWLGPTLTPYGKTASFAQECVNCHAPMRAHDYVYTLPLALDGPIAPGPRAGFNEAASLDLPKLAANPLEGKVITSTLDHATGTMAALFGNDSAVSAARRGDRQWPPGAVLALVTWRQQPDQRWYGGRIPGPVESVELVAFGADASAPPAYGIHRGDPPRKVADADPETASVRTAFILGLRAAVMP